MTPLMTDQPAGRRTFRVSGSVRSADGLAASGIRIAAFDRDLRSEQLLGQAESDRNGAYRIEYSEGQFLPRERGTADLVVKALDADGSILVASPVLFNAPEEAAINLTIPLERQLPPTLFERIESAVKPLLGSVKVEELEEDEEHQDLAFLSGETGLEKSTLARFVLAQRLAALGIEREFWFGLLGGSVFEYTDKQGLNENLAAVRNALPSLDARAVRKAVVSSVNRREIPAQLKGRTDEWTEAFLKLTARLSLGDDKSPTFVRMALEHAGIKSPDKQAKFARLFNQHEALTPEFLTELEKEKSFKKTEIADLRTSYQLAELTRGDFSVVKMLKEEFNVRRPELIRTLARQSERQWVELIERKHKAGDIKLPLGLSEPAAVVRPPEADVYAKTLERQFREAFPTAAFAGGLERAFGDNGVHGMRHAESLGLIIERHPEFDLLRTRVDEFLSKGIGAELQTLAKDESFRLELKAVQRVFKLAPTFEATDALLADGLHSAQMVYRLGESEFVRRYGNRPAFTADSARLAWNRAADTHAAVLTVIGDLAEFDSGILPGVLRSSHPDLETFPNWNNLFKSGDICHCEHCRSALSPAAYFTDLLIFLKERMSLRPKPGGGFYSVRDILFDRRADLGYLELNCENALTALPYVDVVCEVLERAVDSAGDNDLVLTGFTTIPADPAGARNAIAEAFDTAFTDPANDGKAKLALGDAFSLSQVDPTDADRWVVHGEDATYLLKKKGTPNFSAELLPNTKATSEELRAYPAHVNPKAYDVLKVARHPLAVPLDLFSESDSRRAEQRARAFSLPFDLFAEEARAAFRKCNLQRWDLMRTFRGRAAPNSPTAEEIAAEYFGISCDADVASDEKRLILDADPTVAGQQALWGETGNADWLNPAPDSDTSVANVKTFLRKSGLEYEELLALLDLKFINPVVDILIQHLDASCDTNQKVIQGLNAEKLDRIHRFLRLWRKLAGWEMWELDLVLRCSGIGHRGAGGEWLLDEPLLINLYHLGRLRNWLGAKTTVEQLCGLFEDLSTETHFTKPHGKRADGLYQSLFLNRKLIQPLDPAFEVAEVDVAGPTVEKISGHRPAILSALGVRETDLDILAGLTRASDGTAYITDDLTLANLSFLWRHAWLAKLLKLKVDEWKIVLKLLQEDIQRFADPDAAFEFLEKVDHLRATGFTPDELNWLLAADRTAKAAVRETDAARFLTTLRRDLQAVRGEYAPARFDFIEPPADLDRLTALLSSLLQQLHRDEAGAKFFIDTLRDEIIQTKTIPGLPRGFTFPAVITGPPPNQNIRIKYEPVLQFGGVMTAAQRAVLLTVDASQSYQDAIQALFDNPGSPTAVDLGPGFSFPPAITGPPNNIAIRYEPVVRFIGLMTAAQKSTLLTHLSLVPVTGIGSYQQAIEEFFQAPRLTLKFLDPVFTAPLSRLPATADFKALPDPALALKVSYDTEERALRFVGILSADEKAALDALSADLDYRNAVDSLFIQPTGGVFRAERLWLEDADLLFPLRDLESSANDNLNANIAVGVKKALAYLSKTLSEGLSVQRVAGEAGLTEGLTRRLLTQYAILPESLLAHLTDPGLANAFVTSASALEYADPTRKATFDGWFWASRVAALWKKWKLTLAEWERVHDLTAGAQLLDFAALPLDATGAMAPIVRFLRTSRLVRFKDSLPETGITLLEVLVKLNAGAAQADFSHDVQLLNEAWRDDDVAALVTSLDLAYPTDYLLAESWERLRRAFYFVESLNAGAETVKAFAAATMTPDHAKTIKELLRSKFGGETWLALSAEIQDVLRERKRDALAAYLLAQPKPPDAPTGKWENTNDLYAYYLLDVEMGACQLTSRLVQSSGSAQLFVQRCFMGLEPDVNVQAGGPDGDSAWRWWKWMRKYRVWEANRKVFLWPENWIEPELRKDRSSFFKDLENELLQNELNQYTVETAFANYLEKLDGVAQLEIAGFYQEDDGEDSILHVFGRTAGAEPHIYYYRRYDYRQWTPWEKVDLDIQGDYLIPAVVNGRLFLFWPVFTEVPYEAGNTTVRIPSAPGNSPSSFTPDKTQKRLKLQMAVSEYRQGKWTPRRVSTDYDESYQYDIDIVRKSYVFHPVDRSTIDGRFLVFYGGCSIGANDDAELPIARASLSGAFELSGRGGAPVLVADTVVLLGFGIKPERDATGAFTSFLKWVELRNRTDSPEDFTIDSAISGIRRVTPVLNETPGIFRMSPPWHLSYMDRLKLTVTAVPGPGGGELEVTSAPAGSWLPFFYNDKKRSFFVLPSLWSGRSEDARMYYPNIKRTWRLLESHFEGQIRTWADTVGLPAADTLQRRTLEASLQSQVPGETVPPFTDTEVRERLVRVFMRYVRGGLGQQSLTLFDSAEFHFLNFYHAFVRDFADLIRNPLQGVSALMTRETQLKNSGFSFERSYRPTSSVVDPSIEDPTLPEWAIRTGYPKETVDFSADGAYSSYNWELFFHAPLLIANALSKNQRFEEARDWYHFIFNPIGVESAAPGGSEMSKYWITKPFFETTEAQYVLQRIENLLQMLAGDTSVEGYSPEAKAALEGQVFDWRTNSFEPHRIANYRTVAYQKTVVMKYLDNSIAWGDYLFRQDSMESINEATQLYILAAELLGSRPKRIPPQAKLTPQSFNELERELDAFANALVEVENLIPPPSGTGIYGPESPPLPMLYFCIPQNEKMLSYWDIVADRLYKIRHCMNIEGVVRQLALFEPPIEPGALVKAVAAGVDIGAALADLNAPLPLYRFNILLQKANEVCGDVKALGAALLSALEKKDAEALSLLRQGQEIRVLEAVKGVREKQIEEAKENLEAVKRSKTVTTTRRDYYRDIEKIIPGEQMSLDQLERAHSHQQKAQTLTIAASMLGYLPNVTIGASGFGGSPHVAVQWGTGNIISALQAASEAETGLSTIASYQANRASTLASYDRRFDDWKLQEGLADRELAQLDKQVAAAELRIAIAEKELANHVMQIDNARETDAFMRSKYTNEELYQWQVGQVAGIYFQSYKLAYDLARRAERCFRFEVGVQDSSLITFGYWDSLKKGLLSGEKLQYDLRRLESAYLEQNRREFELTKHVSLAVLNPLALLKLRETGRCFFRLPEEIFDLDYPGHYFRRIKSVSVSLPCVVGPYTTISCTLRLFKNSVRINTGNGDNGYPHNTDEAGLPADDPRFVENNILVKAIAASNGQNDAGVFELNFRDERYLPFEGAGAISEWSLELFSDLPANNPEPAAPDFGRPLRQFDYGSIADVVLHVKYTAREDAGVFKNGAVTHLRGYFSEDGATPSVLMLNLRREFPTQWSRFLRPTDPGAGNVLELEMSPRLFPIRDAGKTLKVNTIYLLGRCTDSGQYDVTLTPPLPEVPPAPAGANSMTLAKSNQYGGLHFAQKDMTDGAVEIVPTASPVTWSMKMTRPGGGNLTEDPVRRVMEVEDAILILGYQWEWDESTPDGSP